MHIMQKYSLNNEYMHKNIRCAGSAQRIFLVLNFLALQDHSLNLHLMVADHKICPQTFGDLTTVCKAYGSGGI